MERTRVRDIMTSPALDDRTDTTRPGGDCADASSTASVTCRSSRTGDWSA